MSDLSEPWRMANCNTTIFNSKDMPILYNHIPYLNQTMLERIVACVNACSGVPADELNAIKLSQVQEELALYHEGGPYSRRKLQAELDAAKNELARLTRAL